MSDGAVAPTKVKTEAPSTPAGLPRLEPVAVSCSLIFAVKPLTETTSSPGAAEGGGIGVGPDRTVNPSVNFCASVTVAVPLTRLASSRALFFRLVSARGVLRRDGGLVARVWPDRIAAASAVA